MIESILAQLAEQYRPQIEALEQKLASDEGLLLLPPAPLTREQHQKLLFGHLFAGADQPLNLPESTIYKQVPSQRAFVNHFRVRADMGRERYMEIMGR